MTPLSGGKTRLSLKTTLGSSKPRTLKNTRVFKIVSIVPMKVKAAL